MESDGFLGRCTIYSGKEIRSVQILLDINNAVSILQNIREQLLAGNTPIALVSEIDNADAPPLDIASRMFDPQSAPDPVVLVARNLGGEDYSYLAEVSRVEFFEGVSAEGILSWPLSPQMVGNFDVEVEPGRFRAVIFEIKTDA